MAVRDSIKVVSASKPHVSRSLGRIGVLAGQNTPRAIRAIQRERRFLNALGLNVRTQIITAAQQDVAKLIAAAELIQDVQELEKLIKIGQELQRAKALVRRRQIKLGDQAVSRIIANGVSAKAPLMAQFTEDSMGIARQAHADSWVWTANQSACAVCLVLHGSLRQGDFNPPHPGCLCIAEEPGLSRRLTNEEIANQLIGRGGRDARLGRALLDGSISRNQLSVRRNGIIKQRNFNIPNVSGPIAPYRNTGFLNQVGPSPVEDFYSGFATAKQGKYGAFLSDLDQTFFEGDNVRVFTALDGKVGGALTYHEDGRVEIGSLFADPDAPDGAGRDMLRYLMQEQDGNWLSNFDGPLTEFYIEEGFTVVSRSPWNFDFAPADWNYEKFGTPDYIEMAKVKK
jgi:hypothetical protein